METSPLSLRVPRETREWLDRFARGRGTVSRMAAQLLEEARRRALHPGVDFLDTPAGRRAVVAGTRTFVAEVWRFRERTGADAVGVADRFGWSVRLAEAALGYLVAYPAEMAADAEDLLGTLMQSEDAVAAPATEADGELDQAEEALASRRVSHPFSSLIEDAKSARLRAYAPYSRFRVGAALLGKGWRVFQGCNVENLSYGLTICAERNALVQAVAAGVTEFEAIAVVADTRHPISPCGACRQFMAEFGDFRVLSVNLQGDVFESTVGDLLPRSRTGILDLD